MKTGNVLMLLLCSLIYAGCTILGWEAVVNDDAAGAVCMALLAPVLLLLVVYGVGWEHGYDFCRSLWGTRYDKDN